MGNGEASLADSVSSAPTSRPPTASADDARDVSEQRFRTLAEASPVGIYRTDASGRAVYTNQRWYRIAGLEPGADRRGWAAALHPDDRQRVLRAWAQTVQAGCSFQCEYRYLRPDGTVVWVVGQATPERSEDGAVTGYVGTITDITEHRRAEEALRVSEEQYRRLVEGVRMIAWEYDPDTKRFVFVSQHAQEILGYPLEAWHEPRFWYDHLHPDDREQAAAYSRQQVELGLDHEFEYRMARADGTAIWIKDITTVVLRHGRPVGLHGVFIDITDRKQAEDALRQSEQRFRSLAEGSSVGFWQITPEGRTIYINKAMCRLLEIDDPDELAGRTFHEFFTAESLAQVTIEHEKRLAGFASSYEVEVVGRRGGPRSLIISGAPLLDQHGRLSSLIGTFTDITQRKHVEEALRRSTELQRKMLSELDHRVRNNLAALAALIDISTRDKKSVTDFAASIKSRVQAMSAVHSLLSGSHWLAVSLRSLVETLTPADLPGALAAEGPDVLVAARQVTALGMVLQELMANSLKYGALKNQTGRVDLHWSLSDAGESNSRRLDLQWRETGGPLIQNPAPPGQGTALILGFVQSELGGKAEMNYPHGGALHKFTFNLDRPQ